MNIKHAIYIMLATSLIVILSSVRFALASPTQQADIGFGTVKEIELQQTSPAIVDAETDIYYSDVYDRYVEWQVISLDNLEKELKRLREINKKA